MGDFLGEEIREVNQHWIYIYYGETEKHMKNASQRILQLREVMTMAV